MEKTKPQEQKNLAKQSSEITNNRVIWDCGSSLYDSFELKALEKQLHSAIASRTLSMPHLSDRRRLPPPQPPSNKKPTSKISRSFHKLVRAVFRPKNSTTINTKNDAIVEGGGFYVVSKIGEVPQFDGLLTGMGSLVRRTSSERFTSVGISCS